MGGSVKDILKQHAWPIIGFAALWPCFHASPYYPFVLSPGFSAVGVDILSLRHVVYASALCAFFLAAWFVERGKPGLFFNKQLCIVAGVVATLASIVMASGLIADKSFAAVENFAMLCIAFGVAVCFIALFVRVVVEGPQNNAFILASSYVLYSLVWLVCEVVFAPVVPLLLCACPGLAVLCIAMASANQEDVSQAAYASRGLPALPWSMLIVSSIFVYFGVICVRIFTAMGQGEALAGQLVGLPYIITAATGLVLSFILSLYFAFRGYTNNRALASFAALTLLYLGALLLVMVSQDGTAALLGKRIMVAAEHCFELLILVVLSNYAARTHAMATPIAAIFGIVVLVLPQIISLDLLLQTGLLARVAQMNLIMPVAAVSTFIIAVLLVGMLLKSMQQTAETVQLSNEEWQRQLCAQALEGAEATPRELDVVLLTYQGLSAKKVAEKLYVSESTVKAHLQHAYRKLDVHSKQELIAYINSFQKN